MADQNEIPKMRLARKFSREESSAVSPREAEVEEPESQELKLKQERTEFVVDSEETGEKVRVEDLLDVAHAPDRLQLKRERRERAMAHLLRVVSASFVVLVLTFGYAHLWMRWPVLGDFNLYLPFLLSSGLSTYFLLAAYQHAFVLRERSLGLVIFGLSLAVGLAYWNLRVLDYVANVEQREASNLFWEAEDSTELLMAYEINAALGGPRSVDVYTSHSIGNYKSAFFSIPQNEWKPFFRRHLSGQEMELVAINNIDHYLRIVIERMHAQRQESWNGFTETLASPPIRHRVVEWGLKPYTFLLGHF